ncbi:MAG: DUF2470 domain-containing protein [Acidimicrobiia bacterium]|nr:DUF2470 domain-containing protein [Acidimicrobiia bacterium]
MSSTPPFTADVVEAVIRHMNDDHAADTLDICRTLGGLPTATAARVTGLDPTGMTVEATLVDGTTEVTVPWDEVPADRRAIRTEVVRMTEQARATLSSQSPPG